MRTENFITIVVLLFTITKMGLAQIQIPKESDWINQGVVLTNGSTGDWDARLHGMISPCTIVKKSGTFYLYYIGADGNRSTDGGPRHRALGVATSSDGLHFQKSNENPILTFLPHNNQEEGIFSLTAALDKEGNLFLYYGALTAPNSTSESVRSDVRIAKSSDGIIFTDIGEVLSSSDPSVWGYGDELFPIGFFRNSRNWYVYYLAKGNTTRWDLGVAIGSTMDKLPNSHELLTSGSYIIGDGDPIQLSPTKVAFFILRDFDNEILEVRTATAEFPDKLSNPVEIYKFNGYRHTIVFLDENTNRWLMYQRKRQGNEIILRTAPIVKIDQTPPAPPTGVDVETGN